MEKQRMIILSVVPSPNGDRFMDNYTPQIATVQEFESLEKAATCNVGTHPEAKKTGKPYRVVVIPFEHWHEFEVYSESVHGRDQFTAYPSENLTIRPTNESGEIND